jgi:hypothetical protein
MSKRVRAKADLPWPVTGVYLCDKCHTQRTGQAGIIATRCTVLLGEHQRQCNGAYFVLIERSAPDESTAPLGEGNPEVTELSPSGGPCALRREPRGKRV